MLLAQPIFLHYTQAELDLLHGNLTLKDFTKEGIADKAAVELVANVHHEFDDGIKGGLVRIGTKDGRSLESHILLPLGDASRPMSRRELDRKISGLLRVLDDHAVFERRPEANCLIDHLEDADPTDLARITSPTGK
jgi:MmgE/PrpD C-terminal domain